MSRAGSFSAGQSPQGYAQPLLQPQGHGQPPHRYDTSQPQNPQYQYNTEMVAHGHPNQVHRHGQPLTTFESPFDHRPAQDNRKKGVSVAMQDKFVMTGAAALMTSPNALPSGLTAITIANQILSKVVNECNTFQKPDSRLPPFGLTSDDIQSLCEAVIKRFKKTTAPLARVHAPAKVFGDIHGNIMDLVTFFSTYGKPCESPGDIRYMNYIFNGDFVDRGEHSLEVILTLLSLKLIYWNRITLIRGNHECLPVNTVYGFLKECNNRLQSRPTEIHKLFNNVFSYLPLAASIQILKKTTDGRSLNYTDHILVMHGGIGSGIKTLKDIEDIPSPLENEETQALAMNLMWNDPSPETEGDFLLNPTRGDSTQLFTAKAVTEFCKRCQIFKIIRSHQCVENGFEKFADNQLITVFSARNYANRYKNSAAILVVTHTHGEPNAYIDVCILEYSNPSNIQRGSGALAHGAEYAAQFSQRTDEDKYDSSPISLLKKSKMKPHVQAQHSYLELATQKCFQEKRFGIKQEASLRDFYTDLTKESKFDIELLSVFLAHYMQDVRYVPSAETIMRTFNLTGEKIFDWETFKRFVFFTTQSFKVGTLGHQIHLLYVFRFFDTDDDGYLSLQELGYFTQYHKTVGNRIDYDKLSRYLQQVGASMLNFEGLLNYIIGGHMNIQFPFLKFHSPPA